MDGQVAAGAGPVSGREVAWIRIGPLAILLILGATAVSADFRSPSLDLVVWSVSPTDVFLNLLLFVPLGVALAGRGKGFVLVVAALLSLGLETLQLAQAGRHAAPLDVVCNATGAYLGSLVQAVGATGSGRIGLARGEIWIDRRLFAALALGAGSLLLVATLLPRATQDFSNWDPTYRLAVSDELTRDRTWSGALDAFAIFERPLDSATIRELAQAGPEGLPPEMAADAVKVWRSPTPGRASGFLELDPDSAHHVHDRLTDSGTMSLLAWLRSDDIEQSEAERIVTLSGDQYNRNFTLSQDRRAFEFRLRTPATGPNGIGRRTVTREVVRPGTPHFVAATYDGLVIRVFVDGVLLGRESVAASAAAFPALQDLRLPLVLALCGACFTAGLACLFPAARPGSRWLLGMLGGGGVSGAVALAGAGLAWPLHPVGVVWWIGAPLAGALVLTASLAFRGRAQPADGTPISRGRSSSPALPHRPAALPAADREHDPSRARAPLTRIRSGGPCLEHLWSRAGVA